MGPGKSVAGEDTGRWRLPKVLDEGEGDLLSLSWVGESQEEAGGGSRERRIEVR